MAFIHKQAGGSAKHSKKQIGLVLILTLTLWAMLKTGTDTISADNPAILICVAGSVLFFILVAFKKNPLNWLPPFRKSPPQYVFMPQLLDDLLQLNEFSHVFPGIRLEFFKIDCLVVSPQGLFVVRTPGNDLVQGSKEMDRETEKLWQRCHMINMLIKKGYDKEILPTPLLAMPVDQGFDQNGVAVMAPGSILAHISQSDAGLDQSFVESFSFFLAQRYLR